MNEFPFGYFITWTVYGTFLQGDARWWRKRSSGSTAPQPKLEQWHRDRLNHDVVLLTGDQREIVNDEIHRLAEFRGWKPWVANARTNHVHAVVTARQHLGKQVRDQMKANCTRALREAFSVFVDRPVWTTGGDVECLSKEDDLEQAILYAGEAQDRMARGK